MCNCFQLLGNRQGFVPEVGIDLHEVPVSFDERDGIVHYALEFLAVARTTSFPQTTLALCRREPCRITIRLFGLAEIDDVTQMSID